MSQYKVERRTFLFGAILAPFASRFAAAGVEPRRSGTVFDIKFNGRLLFNVYLTEAGDIDEVTCGFGPNTFQMKHDPWASTGDLRGRTWKTFTFSRDMNSAIIKFRVNEEGWLDIDYACAWEGVSPSSSSSS